MNQQPKQWHFHTKTLREPARNRPHCKHRKEHRLDAIRAKAQPSMPKDRIQAHGLSPRSTCSQDSLARDELVRRAYDQCVAQSVDHKEQAKSFLHSLLPHTPRSKVRQHYSKDPKQEKKERNALASQRNRENKMEYDTRLEVANSLLDEEIRALEDRLAHSLVGPPSSVPLEDLALTLSNEDFDFFLGHPTSQYCAADQQFYVSSSSSASPSPSSLPLSTCDQESALHQSPMASLSDLESPQSILAFSPTFLQEDLNLQDYSTNQPHQAQRSQPLQTTPHLQSSWMSSIQGRSESNQLTASRMSSSAPAIMSAVLASQWRLLVLMAVACSNLLMDSSSSLNSTSISAVSARWTAASQPLPAACASHGNRATIQVGWGSHRHTGHQKIAGYLLSRLLPSAVTAL
jgi:hypothetical protein